MVLKRVSRGNSFYDHARYCRSAFRNRNSPGDRSGDLGFAGLEPRLLENKTLDLFIELSYNRVYREKEPTGGPKRYEKGQLSAVQKRGIA